MFSRSGQVFKKVYIATPSAWIRQNSAIAYKALTYEKFGEPLDVLQMTDECAEMPKGHQVLLKMLAAPINPADVNTIQGKYPVEVKFPKIAGNEGVGEVVAIGDQVKHMKCGDNAILLHTGMGSWRSYGLFEEKQVFKIPKEVCLSEAAMLAVNPCTAYRMLHDFVKLKSGDTVIMNGASGAVGQWCTQLCKALGYNFVGVVRDGSNLDKQKADLECLGAAYVLSETEVAKTKIFKDGGELKKPKLALNCVGGDSARNISRHLANSGYMVTFGGMSKKPVVAPTPALIFRDTHYVGFWMTRWTSKHNNSKEQTAMLNLLCQLMIEGKLLAPAHEFVSFEDYKKAEPAFAMKNAQKILFKMH